MAHPHNFRLAVRSFLKLCTVKETNGWMKKILRIFSQKFLFGANGPLRNRNGASVLLGIRSKNCFTILHSERDQERHGNNIIVFSAKRSYSRHFCHFCPKVVRNHNFLDLPLVFFFSFAQYVISCFI